MYIEERENRKAITVVVTPPQTAAVNYDIFLLVSFLFIGIGGGREGHVFI